VGIIHPGEGFDRPTRELIDQYDSSYVIIEADPEDGKRALMPIDFQLPTLKWAIRSATLVVVWGGQRQFNHEQLTELLQNHVGAGARIVIALVPDVHHDPWVQFVFKHSYGKAEVFGLGDIPGLTGEIARQDCQSSGAVH
jgi:hypothetical protein